MVVVHPEAEAALALCLLEDNSSKKQDSRQCKKQNGKASGRIANQGAQQHHEAAVPAPVAATVSLAQTPVAGAVAGAQKPEGGNPRGASHGAAATPPVASTPSPHRSPQDLLQVILHVSKTSILLHGSASAVGHSYFQLCGSTSSC